MNFRLIDTGANQFMDDLQTVFIRNRFRMDQTYIFSDHVFTVRSRNDKTTKKEKQK